MTAAVGIDLHGLRTRGGHAAGVVVRLQIPFHHGHAKLARKVAQRPLQQRGFAGAGRTDQIKGQNPLVREQPPHMGSHFFIGFKHIAHYRNLHAVLLVGGWQGLPPPCG